MAGYFPFFTDIAGAHVLVLGGMRQALQKIERVLPYAPRITAVAPTFCAELQMLAQQGKITTVCRNFDGFEEILAQSTPAAVLVTDGDDALAARVFAACKARGIPINTEDKTRFCSFIFPSLVKRGALTVAISTSGASPAVAKRLREQVEALLPDATEQILDWLGALRPTVREDRGIAPARRAALWRELADAAFAADRPLTKEEAETILQKYRD